MEWFAGIAFFVWSGLCGFMGYKFRERRVLKKAREMGEAFEEEVRKVL
jgi:hypothetical protein